MKKIHSILFLFFLTFSLYPQNAILDLPKENILREVSLPRVDTYIAKSIKNKILPGGVFIVAEKGEIIYFKNFGSKENGKSFEKNDIFRIASMTKAITVTAIMQLIEQKKIKLSDPVYKYIPSFKNTRVFKKFNIVDSTFSTFPLKNDITIKNLLTHTSGIYYGDFETGELNAIYKKNNMLGLGLSSESLSTEEMVDRIAKMPLAFQPGSAWKYGLNMEVLGRIVEVVSGQNLAVYFDKYIFDPLEMNDTYFYLPKEKQDRLVHMNYPDSLDQLIYGSIMKYPKLPDHDHYAGGGGLSSTTLDYAKFCMALSHNGELNGKRILKAETVKQLYSEQYPELNYDKKGFSDVKGIGFGLGFAIILEERPLLWPFNENTYFWSGYFNTKYWIDPQKDLIFVGMTQIYSFKHKKFWSKLYKELFKDLNKLK